MNKEALKKRDSSLDLIRIFAFMSVVSVHFFLHVDFYSTPEIGVGMYAMTLVRTFFMVCVPLFLMLSGYLCNKKKLSKQYFFGIIKILGVYFLAGISCLLFKSLTEDLNIVLWVVQIFNFTSAPYAWYIEMYVGLFLLIPFINILYNGLKNKKEKQAFLFVLVFLTILPGIVNAKMQSIPSWWIDIYPITYYVVGAYLAEYPPKIKNRTLLMLLIVHIGLSGTYIFFRSHGINFVDGFWNNWKSITNFISAILIFMIIKNINTIHWNVNLKGVIKYISGITLGAYLVSWIFDSIFYPILNSKVELAVMRFSYFIPMVLTIAVCSLFLSAIISGIYNVVAKIISGIYQKHQIKKYKTI